MHIQIGVLVEWPKAWINRIFPGNTIKNRLDYKNVWDDQVHWMHTRNADGSWLEWKGKLVQGQGCVESNPFQQGWFVPHDVAGLVDLMGEKAFENQLKEMFDKAPENFQWNDYYNHANEPVHHVAYLFDYIGKPWLTQKYVRKILDHAYNTGIYGLCGNDDVGQMSAWYVLSAMGFHPVCPGDDEYMIGSPLFEKITIQLDQNYDNGKTFTIEAINNSSSNIYIQQATLNGKPINRCWLTHKEIVDGGRLELVMGPGPNEDWGIDPNAKPYSLSSSQHTIKANH